MVRPVCDILGKEGRVKARKGGYEKDKDVDSLYARACARPRKSEPRRPGTPPGARARVLVEVRRCREKEEEERETRNSTPTTGMRRTQKGKGDLQVSIRFIPNRNLAQISANPSTSLSVRNTVDLASKLGSPVRGSKLSGDRGENE